MNSFNFQVVSIDTISSIQIPFPEHICYFTYDTEKYYICKDEILKEIFVDTTSLTWSNITNKPTTITGYGITDAVKSNNGTVNYVAKFTPDGATIGNSQIIDDGTNITVGSTTDVDSLVTVNTQTLSNALFSSSKKTTGTNRGLYGEAIGNGASFNYGLHSYATGANLNIGVNTRALGTGTVIGIKAEAQGTGSKYSIQLQDGTEAAGKFLKSVTAEGRANWANITPSDIQGSIGTVTSVGITLGTSGDDINISNSPITSSGSINLNVPTASATARGLLSSSDWTTFNDKIGGIGQASFVPRFFDSKTIYQGVIQDDGTDVGIKNAPNPIAALFVSGAYNTHAIYATSTSSSNGKAVIHGASEGDGASTNTGLFGTAYNSQGPSIGVSGFASGNLSADSPVIGGVFQASNSLNNLTNYSVQLLDGSQAEGKFLKSVTIDGKANWANITASDIQGGGVVGSGTVNYLSKWTPDGSTLGDSQIQDDGDTIGFGISPNPDISYYFSSTDKPVGKWFVHSYTGSDSVVSSDIELSGTVSTFNKEAIGYGVTNLISNLSGNGKNYGIKGTVSGADINIGASFTATGGANAYAIELKDGTQAAGKFLKSVTGDGKANWANITTADIQGYQASSFSLSESKAIYVDATYGNDTTGAKYDPSKPFLTWSAALAVAVTGDWIIFNAGTYTQAMTPTSNINVYCKPGVIFSAGFSITTSTTWRLHGYATFDATTPLVITSSGATHDIYFEYDRTTGLCNSGVECNDLTAAMLRLTYNCNYLTASRPLRFDNNAVGATYDVVVNVSQRITGYGDRTIFLPSSFASGSIFGSIIINANIIENTSSSTMRQILWFAPTNTNNFQMYINAKIIRATSTSFTDPGASNVSCVLFYEGGDNININANIDAGELPCIVNRSQGGTPIYGNMTVTGNIFSKREIVQQYQKSANGNGWHDITIKNGFIHSKGIGLSNAMLHRENNWNSIMWGIPGNTRLVDCIIYNENINASATATIIKDDLLDVGKNNNFQLYNCLAFVETSGYLATSVQSTKYISAHNVRTNRPLGATILDGFSPSGVIVDTNLTIPKTNINV